MQNVMEVVFADRSCVLPLTTDDEQAREVFRGIGNWLGEMAKRSKPQRFLCLDCDITFHDRRKPETFAVTVPFVRDGGQTVTIGICRHCAESRKRPCCKSSRSDSGHTTRT
jgi:hypothetical protein